RRTHRSRPTTLSRAELSHRATLHISRVEVRFAVAIVGIGFAEPVEDDRAPVGRPVVTRRAEAAQLAGAEVALGELPGCATLSRHQENLDRALLDVAGAIAAIVEAVHDARRGRPLRPLGRGRHADLPRRLAL